MTFYAYTNIIQFFTYFVDFNFNDIHYQIW